MVPCRELLAVKGILTIPNQTYLPANARSKPLVNNMLTLPMLMVMTDEEIKRCADAVVECWETIEEVVEPVVEGTGYGTAAWAGLE